MTDEIIVLLVFIGLAVVSAICFHAISRRYFVASFCSGCVVSFAFVIIGTYVAGHVDPFFPIALVVGGVFATGIAVLIGIPFAVRRRARFGQCQKCGYDLTGNVSGVCPECGSLINTGKSP